MPIALSRRTAFLGLAAAACPLCPAFSRDHSPAPAPHWGYAGDAAPEKWGRLQPDFRVCSLGMEQTPIEISPEQVRRFAALFPIDARPVQSVNRQFLLEAL